MFRRKREDGLISSGQAKGRKAANCRESAVANAGQRTSELESTRTSPVSSFFDRCGVEQSSTYGSSSRTVVDARREHVDYLARDDAPSRRCNANLAEGASAQRDRTWPVLTNLGSVLSDEARGDFACACQDSQSPRETE